MYSETNQGEVSAQDILAIFKDRFIQSTDPYTLGNYQITADTQSMAGSRETLEASLISGHGTLTIGAQGSGTIAAFCNALSNHFGVTIDIIQYDQITQGRHTDAQARAFVQVCVNDEKFIASTMQQDSLGASLSAILSGLNQYLSRLDKAA